MPVFDFSNMQAKKEACTLHIRDGLLQIMTMLHRKIQFL